MEAYSIIKSISYAFTLPKASKELKIKIKIRKLKIKIEMKIDNNIKIEIYL